MGPYNNPSRRRSDERIVFDIEPRLVDKVIVFIIILAGLFGMLWVMGYPLNIILALLGVYCLLGGYNVIRTAMTEYIITGDRVIIESGILNKFTQEIHFGDVRGVTVYSNFLSLGKGSIAIETDTNTNLVYKALQPGRGTRLRGITNYREVGNYIRERCGAVGTQSGGSQHRERAGSRPKSGRGQSRRDRSRQGQQRRRNDQRGQHDQRRRSRPRRDHDQNRNQRQNDSSKRD
jgi:hypothetical protein